MVDQALLKELKEKFDAGPADADPNDTLKIYEFIRQIAQENEELKEEIEDMDILVQMIITDIDKKFWVKVKEGIIEYGEGEIDNPSFVFSATAEVGAALLYGEIDATSAYMAGDITVEGNLQDAMAFQEFYQEFPYKLEILELSMEIFEELTENL